MFKYINMYLPFENMHKENMHKEKCNFRSLSTGDTTYPKHYFLLCMMVDILMGKIYHLDMINQAVVIIYSHC